MSHGRRRAGFHCCVKPPTPCGFRHAAITACCASRARLPISTAPKSRPRPHRRSFVLSRARRRNPARGVNSTGSRARTGAAPVPVRLLLWETIAPRMPIAAKNSWRVSALSRKTPIMRLVTMVTPGLWMPRVVMHWCVPSVTTATPCGFSTGIETRGDLGRHLLLDLQPPRIDFDQAGQFGNSDHAVARQIADMHASDDRSHVMLAMRLETDVAQHHDFVVTAGFLECAFEVGVRIVLIAREPFLIGADHACSGWREVLRGRDRRRPSGSACARQLPLLRGSVSPPPRPRFCCATLRIYDIVHFVLRRAVRRRLPFGPMLTKHQPWLQPFWPRARDAQDS